MPGSEVLQPIRAVSAHSTFALKFASVALFLYACSKTFLPLLTPHRTEGELYLSMLITFGGAFLLSLVAEKIGNIFRNTVDAIKPLSYLNLTRGDENAFNQLQAENRRGWIKGTLSIIAAILVNLASSWLASKLGLSP